MRKCCFRAALALLVTVVFSASAFSQASLGTAQLNGTVLDTGGRAVAKAQIVLRSVDTNQSFTASTNEAGFYALPSVPPGRYDLTVSSSGFAKYQQTGLSLLVGQSASVNVTLKVASVGEVITVTTEVPPVEATRTEISQVIDTQQIADLPTVNRRFTDFALLTPGVATSRTALGTTFTEFEVTQISFGGMRSFSNEITVDGADFVNTISGVQRATPPQDSVQEFRVVNNSFGSEYGRALGGIVNVVTRSGTNTLHGSVYDYFQNNSLNSRTILQPRPIPDTLRQNQFGGSLGGPLRKDRTFFFMNYEGQRRAESPTFAPDLVNNIATIDQAKAYIGLSPEGCFLKPAQCTASPLSYLFSSMKTVHNDYGFARLDHQLTTNNRLAVRYIVEDARDLGELVGNTEDGGGTGTPSGGRNLFIRDQALVGTLSSLIKPNVVNSALIQWSRRHYNFPGATGEPDLSVVNDLEFGHNFGTYDAIYESRMQFSDSVDWIKGNHAAKFGFDTNYVWSQNNYPGFTPMRLLFPNLACTVTFANFVDFPGGPPLPGIPGQNCSLPSGADGLAFMYWGTALPRTGFTNGYVPSPATGAGVNSGWPNAFPVNQYSNYAYTLNHGYWGFFAQDQWKIRPTLTLNYGMRWDFETGLGNTVNADYRGFQPRVGLAWSPNNRTVIRSGFGMFFDRNNLTFFFTTGNQKALPGYFCNPPSADPNCAAYGLTPVKVPMIQNQAATGGWQLSALPGNPGTPPDALAGLATFFLTGAPYIPVSLTGPCYIPAGGGPPTGACGVGAGGIQRNARLPYAEQASFEIDHDFGRGFTMNVGYLMVQAHKLVRGNNINVPCPLGTTKAGNPADAQGILDPSGSLTPCQGTPSLGPFGLGPFFGTLSNPSGLEFGVPNAPGTATLSGGLLDYNNDVANAIYHGLTVSAIERMGRLFNLTANYTYGHTIDNGNFTTFINLPPNQFNYAAERANSNQDLRHRLVVNFTATAPERTVLRKFQLSSIVTAQSGRPFTLFVGQNVFGDVAGLSTDRVGGLGGTCTSVSNCDTTVRRNTYVGQPLYTFDLRLSRDIQLVERLKLNLSMDAFNLLNRQNIDEVSSIYGSPVFCGAVPKHYNDATTLAIQTGAPSVSCANQQAAGNPGVWVGDGLLPVDIPASPNSTFGKPRTMLNPRQFQFAAKFVF